MFQLKSERGLKRSGKAGKHEIQIGFWVSSRITMEDGFPFFGIVIYSGAPATGHIRKRKVTSYGSPDKSHTRLSLARTTSILNGIKLALMPVALSSTPGRQLVVVDRRQLIVVKIEFLFDLIQGRFIEGVINHRLLKSERFFPS